MSAYYNEHDKFAANWLRNLIKEGHIAPGVVDERDIQDVSPDDLRPYSQVHLFAGIGGWSYALRLAGWPDNRPVWTGSCPCQPFSSAGKRQGTEDERHLWPDMFRLVRECGPSTVFGEQSARAAGCGWFDGVAVNLESVGYAVGAAIISASAANASHRRDRLWIVAHTIGRERREQPHRRQAGRVGRVEQPVSWDESWASALSRFRAVDDGVPRCVEGTDAARNAIVPQVAAEFVKAYMEATQ